MKFLATVACLLSLSSTFSHAESDSPIRLWTRAPGNYVDGREQKDLDPRVYSFKKEKLVQRVGFDIQYQLKQTYQGAALKAILGSYRVAPNTDTALLHFENSMIIPISLRDEVLDRLDVFVANAVKIEGVWRAEFPAVAKPEELPFRDPRPLRFGANKIVVRNGWHPDAAGQGQDGFSPWMFANTLVGIEFVDGQAYNKQFDGGEKSAEGQRVFLERCQFCHGVKQVGARYGWDFAWPLPIYKHKSPEHLFNHVRYPKWDALRRGLMMPAQKSIEPTETKVLWQWMKVMTVSGPRTYIK